MFLIKQKMDFKCIMSGLRYFEYTDINYFRKSINMSRICFFKSTARASKCRPHIIMVRTASLWSTKRIVALALNCHKKEAWNQETMNPKQSLQLIPTGQTLSRLPKVMKCHFPLTFTIKTCSFKGLLVPLKPSKASLVRRIILSVCNPYITKKVHQNLTEGMIPREGGLE